MKTEATHGMSLIAEPLVCIFKVITMTTKRNSLNILSVLIMLLTPLSVFGQEFMYDLIFEDSEGNLDTLVFGYDEFASDTLDDIFDEINIIDVAINEDFDVRITNEWSNRVYYNIPGTYHTKKQITEKIQGPLSAILNVDIITENWPVSIRWDSTLFIDAFREGSLITSINPGGWWDTGSPSNMNRVVLKSQSQAIFTSNHQNFFNENYMYLDNNNDTIPVYWHILTNISILSSDVEDFSNTSNIRIFPNPTSGSIVIETEMILNKFLYLTVHDISGKFVREYSVKENQLDLSNLPTGVYFLQLYDENGNIELKRIIKM